MKLNPARKWADLDGAAARAPGMNDFAARIDRLTLTTGRPHLFRRGGVWLVKPADHDWRGVFEAALDAARRLSRRAS